MSAAQSSLAVSSGGADPQTMPPLEGLEQFEPVVLAGVRELHGAGHYHETYEKRAGTWLITSLHLTRTLLRMLGGPSSDKG